MRTRLLVASLNKALFLPPSSFPTTEELAEPLDEVTKSELLEHASDDDVFAIDNSAHEYR